ncbi:OmpA family protein [Citreimonas salinaria]|uniref:Outer membrane protein OmpA n=1 Tax=Citreimonas salinaria TaxID=321339 RepID=A0A1H3MJP6_9RHOB|nr:OmpA family protein [Citreimonas salinaria]SDY76349.1 Outer membrane protein OmpA [Citreimonas salinaria]
MLTAPKTRTFAALAALIAVAACGTGGPEQGSFNRGAGAQLDGGQFGNATMANHLAMTRAERYTYDMARRFADEVVTVVNFAFNSAQLSDQARQTLREQARFIRQFPEVTFRVYGHTDLVGSEDYNYRLGLRRAQAVVAYLAAQGISTSRLEALVSYGEEQPLIVTEGRERRNRRTVTEVSGFVADHPRVLNGQYAEVIWRGYVASAVPPTTLTGSPSAAPAAE